MTGIIGVTVHAWVSKWSERRRVGGLVSLKRGRERRAKRIFRRGKNLSRSSKVGLIIPVRPPSDRQSTVHWEITIRLVYSHSRKWARVSALGYTFALSYCPSRKRGRGRLDRDTRVIDSRVLYNTTNNVYDSSTLPRCALCASINHPFEKRKKITIQRHLHNLSNIYASMNSSADNYTWSKYME